MHEKGIATLWMAQTLKTCLIETFLFLVAVNSISISLTKTLNVSQDNNCSTFHIYQGNN